jgi:hypothetical protein
MEEKTQKRRKRTAAEKLLHEARQNPSRTCNDPRQLSLTDAIKQRAFYNLDQEIARKLDDEDGGA